MKFIFKSNQYGDAGQDYYPQDNSTLNSETILGHLESYHFRPLCDSVQKGSVKTTTENYFKRFVNLIPSRRATMDPLQLTPTWYRIRHTDQRASCALEHPK